MKRNTNITGLIVVCFLAASMFGSVFAQNGSGENAAMDKMIWQKKSFTATVEEVMPDSSMIALKGPKGNTLTVRVGEDVDLASLKKGDMVTAEVFHARAVQIRRPTAEDMRQPLVIEQDVEAPEGVIPKGGMLRQIRTLVMITGVDKADSTVTVKGPMDKSYVLTVADPAMFDTLKKGEQWVVVYAEGIVASVRKQ